MGVDKKHMMITFNVDAIAAEVDGMLQAAIDAAVDNVTTEVARLETLGMSRVAIKEKLLVDLANNTGIFAKLVNDAGRVASDGVNMMNQAAYYQGVVDDMNELYYWTLDPGAEHCDDCLDRATWPAMTFAEWQDNGLPGSGVTRCGHNCRCSLVPADIANFKGGA